MVSEITSTGPPNTKLKTHNFLNFHPVLMHFYGVQNAHFCEVPFSYALIFFNAFPSNFDMTVLSVIFFFFYCLLGFR